MTFAALLVLVALVGTTAAAPVREVAQPPSPAVEAQPAAPARLSVPGALLEIESGSVAAAISIQATPLKDKDLMPLEPGMTNVTGAGQRGVRFTPHGAHFAKPLRLTLTYDRRLLPNDMADDDVRAWYYDDELGRWVALERVEVLAPEQSVVSLTDHFTDIIVATLTPPSQPQLESFAPTMMQDMKAADPGEGLDVVAPPEAGPTGEARLTYPLRLPLGRNGVQPSLGLEYSSQGSDGWLGVGWQLPMRQIEIDTRWGVPRYGALPDESGTIAYRDLETESYLLDGSELTPVAHRAAFVARTGDVRVFHARVEGGFQRIVRHGNRPNEFWWEVTDRDGTRSLYGEAPELGPGAGALRDDTGDVFRWALRETRDAHGNAVRYQYDLVTDPGVPGGGVTGRQLYLRSIDYTGRSSAGGYQPGAYTVRFIRDSDPGVARRVNRRDVSIDCRGGFKQVTADLLRGIRIELLGERIREYELDYEEGAFGRTRLVSVRPLGADGTPFQGAEHRFTYFDDVRDATNQYASGFAAKTAWQVPSDDLTLCSDLGPVNVCPSAFGGEFDRATAMGGSITHTIGGHAYIGFNCGLPSKLNSVGFKVGSELTQTHVQSALIDVNGDGLPDKVFRSGSGFVYRANEARPGGQAAFSAQTRPLPGIDELSTESMVSGNAGAESYLFGVTLGANVSSGLSLGTTYSADANGDGLVDIVQNGTVHYAHLDASGEPLFEPTSIHTPLPLAAGRADGDSLVGDYEPLFQDLVDQHPLVDVFRRWSAPYDGFVQITGSARLESPDESEDGVRVSIQRNDAVVWSARIDKGDRQGHAPAGLERFQVSRGDRFYFRVQSLFDGTGDAVAWDPLIQYLDVAPAPDANGLDANRYHASEDFVLAGRAGRARMPSGGRVHLTGVFEKRDTTSDDVAVSVRRSGRELLHAPLPWDSTGTVSLDLSFDVAGDDTTTHDVDEADQVQVQVVVDSPIDASKVGWREDAPPELTFESVTSGQFLSAASGTPIQIIVPADVDIYPADGLTAPQTPWVAPRDGHIDVRTTLGGDWTFRRIGVEDPSPDGDLTFTIKRAGVLLAKRTLAVRGSRAANDTLSGLAVQAGDSIYFDTSMREASARGQVGAVIDYEEAGLPRGTTAPCVLHSNVDFDDVTTLGRGLFGQPYRGWTYAGYNGNPARGDAERPQACVQPRPVPTAPIREADLVLSESLVQLATQRAPTPRLAAQAEPDAQRAFAMSPVRERLADGTLRASWRGPEEATYVRSTVVGATRLGSPLIGVPCPGDLAGNTVEDHRGVPRIGHSLNISGTAGFDPFSVGGSFGHSASDLDFMDVNGDRFPDLVAHHRIQYTLPNGALEAKSRPVAVDTLRRSFNLAGSAGLGFNQPETKGGSRGTAGANNKSAPRGEDTQNLEPSLGISVDGGAGSSDVRVDLIDVNGDGLPDRVTDEGNVSLNLGYSFAAPEPWPGFTGLDHSTSLQLTVAPGIGFNDGIYGYAGGLSYTRSRSRTHRSLLDLNGDGLPDLLRDDAGDLWVAFNAGSRFLPEVRWGGASLDEIAATGSANLSGGAYVTIPVPIFMCSPVTVLFLIINPGASVSASMGRQETGLVDVDGDGCADLVTSSRDDEMLVAHNLTGRTNLLREVERPLGGRLAMDYARVGNTPDLPQAAWALSRVEVSDGVDDEGPSPLVTTFAYGAPHYDRGEREFLGFGEVTEQHRSAEDPDRVVRAVTRTYRNESYYSRGLMASETTTDGTGRALRGATFEYSFRDVATGAVSGSLSSRVATLFPMLARTETRSDEGTPGAGPSRLRQYEYDAAGNVSHVFDAGRPGPGDDLEATISYETCAPDGVLSRANHIVVTGRDGTLAERDATLDCTTGDILQLRQRLGDGSAAVTDLEYTPEGMLRQVTAPANLHGQRNELRYEYDPVLSTYLTRVEDAFGLVSSATHDLKFGRPLTTTDANGNVLSFEYDAFDRTISATGPEDQGTGQPTLRFEHHPEARVPWARTRHKDALRGPGDPLETYVFTDGIGRVIQTKVDGTVHEAPGLPPRDVMIVSGRTRFDGLGRAAEQYQPITEPLGTGSTFNPTFDAQTPSRVEYDVLDRPVESRQPDGSTTRFRYDIATARDGSPARETVIEDANGRQRRILRDLDDALVAIREGASGELWTSYEHDALGRLVSITDPGGNVTRIGYDQLGRRTRLVRPDAGETRYAYDAASNLVSMRTARQLVRGSETRYDYDHTRLIAVRHPADADDDVTYEYGRAGAGSNAAGRVTRITDPAGAETRAYGRLGEVVQSVRTLRSHDDHGDHSPSSFTTRYRYDTWGRLLELTNPDHELIRYGYDAGGLVNSVTSSGAGANRVYIRRMEYDKFQQQAFVELGNGVQTTYEYRPDNQRLARLASRNASGVFQDLRYEYDAVGNVLSLANESVATAPTGRGGPVRQSFHYDELYRLAGATGTYTFGPGRHDEYSLSVSYDALNNIVHQRQEHDLVRPSGRHVRQSKTSFTADYVYSATQPHTATHVGDRTFTFDASGNETGGRGDDEDGHRRKLVWDDEDRVSSLFRQGHELRFTYDAAGRRVIKRGDEDGDIVYVTPFFTVRNGEHTISHIVVGDTRVASRFSGHEESEGHGSRTPDVVYYHPDQLGSVQYLTDSKGAVLQHSEYFPFGEVWVDERHGHDLVETGFAGHEQDEETGLLYFGARYYDPRLGRFLSVDPATEDTGSRSSEASPASLSPYTYASGNPVRLSDPGGRAPGWWSRRKDAFALFSGLGGSRLGNQEPAPQLLSNNDSPSSGGVSGPAGDFLAAAGAGVIHAIPQPSQRLGSNLSSAASGQSSIAPARGPPADAGADPPGEPVATRARSNAVFGDRSVTTLNGLAPVVMGENMTSRVGPYAKSIGAETINDWLATKGKTPKDWTQELNDSWVLDMRAQNRVMIDIGMDYTRERGWHEHPETRPTYKPVYPTERALLVGYSNRLEMFLQLDELNGGVVGFDVIHSPKDALAP